MWKKKVLKMLNERKGKDIALAIDTSTIATRKILINNIVAYFAEHRPDTTFIQADFKIRKISSISKDKTIEWYKHGKSSYTDVLEWANDNDIDTLFYVTDVTGYIYEELNINFDVIWIIPDDFIPKVPFGRALRVV